MDELAALAMELSDLAGPAGDEEEVRQALLRWVSGIRVRFAVDAAGNLTMLYTPEGVEPRTVLVAALDEVGVIVPTIDRRGFARLAPLGAVGAASLVGSRLRLTAGGQGVVGCIPGDGLPSFERLFLDLGMHGRAATEAAVPLGSRAVWDCTATRLPGGQLSGKALGTRAGCAVAVDLLRRLGGSDHSLAVVFCAQTELGYHTVEAALRWPNTEIVLGVGPALASDTPKAVGSDIRLGQGPVLVESDRGLVSSLRGRTELRLAAQRAGVELQVTAADPGTSPAAAALGAGHGIPAAALGIPCRYRRTPSEVCAAEDLTAAARVLEALVRR